MRPLSGLTPKGSLSGSWVGIKCFDMRFFFGSRLTRWPLPVTVHSSPSLSNCSCRGSLIDGSPVFVARSAMNQRRTVLVFVFGSANRAGIAGPGLRVVNQIAIAAVDRDPRKAGRSNGRPHRSRRCCQRTSFVKVFSGLGLSRWNRSCAGSATGAGEVSECGRGRPRPGILRSGKVRRTRVKTLLSSSIATSESAETDSLGRWNSTCRRPRRHVVQFHVVRPQSPVIIRGWRSHELRLPVSGGIDSLD